MKKFFLTVVVTFAFIVMAQAKTTHSPIISSPNGDSSFIYIYRGGSFSGSLTNFAIYVDDQKLCKLSNKRYFKVAVKPGKHVISAHRGGVGIGKKETEVEVDAENGKSNYISCSMKSSITRVRLEMEEVVEKTGIKDISDMKVDNCQANVEDQ
ncbi:MAG TPA: DUF2846 domain-containing protein [Ginsengibacter sp.]